MRESIRKNSEMKTGTRINNTHLILMPFVEVNWYGNLGRLVPNHFWFHLTCMQYELKRLRSLVTEETRVQQPTRGQMKTQRFILISKRGGYRKIKLVYFGSQTVVNAKAGRMWRAEIHLPLFMYLFPLNKTLSKRKHQEDRRKLLCL